uniref:Uncharacterized protein n=1 Tax=Marseillevirus LCMAC201 TaxID=2506605 RepID=A0A481YWU7_9VIRU|nr:MAG: hypothetical protein LCMAC201_01670 [Marseillevirus LCMAC201]
MAAKILFFTEYNLGGYYEVELQKVYQDHQIPPILQNHTTQILPMETR